MKSKSKQKKNQNAPLKRSKNKIGTSRSNLLLTPSTNIYVAPAPGKGRGVFASKGMERGATVELAPGIYIPEDDYGFIAATPLRDYCFIAEDEAGSFIALGCASLYNHSNDPNAEWVVLKDSTMIAIKAIKTIKEDEEITMDYGWDEQQLKEMGIE